MLNEYKKRTNIFIGIGFVLQILYYLTKTEEANIFGVILLWGGIILFTVGCWNYAKGKGYHGAYGLLGLIFNIFGLIILASMPDKHKEAKQDINTTQPPQ